MPVAWNAIINKAGYNLRLTRVNTDGVDMATLSVFELPV